MGEDREQRHICKFCKKSFPCGRSLGGHMRSHMIMNSTATDEKLSNRKATSVNGGSNCNGFMGFEAGGHAGYGLRENPKKTWRLSDSNDATVRQGKTCKECGKAFPSWKALFGHMRCHSEKERVFNNLKEDSWTLENQKLVMDSQSDNEAAAPKGRRRSRRMRYRTTTPTPTFSFANASSSVSEIDQEPEEVAMCLMMLSRDVGQWGGLNSVAESSDNNYIVKEARGRSSGLDKQIREKGIREFIRDGDEIVKKKKNKSSDRKLESVVSNSENVLFEKKICEFHGSDSGFFRDGVKKVESEVSVDGIHWDDEPKKFKLDDEAGFDVSDVELGRPSFNNNRHNGKGSTLDYSEAELGKNLIKEVGMDGTDSKFGKYNSSKRSRNDGYDHESGGDSNKKIRYDASESEICRDNQKRSRYECTTCNKIFHSYQALGGHRASHKKVKGCFASTIECSENSIETDVSPDPTADSKLIKSCSNEKPVGLDRAGSAETCHGSKKSKGHECPICFKVFASGQALGGHKRSHLVGGSESRGNQTIVIQHQLPEIRDLLDLNLPAPIEEENGGCMGFNSCWVGSNHKHEPLVGLISN